MAWSFQDRKNPLFCTGQQLPRLVNRVVGVTQDVGARVDERPQERLIADDLGIVHRVRRMRHRLEHFGQEWGTPDPLEVSLSPKLLEDDRRVDPFAAVVQLHQVPVEQLMSLVGEVFGTQHKGHVITDVGL